MIYSLNLVNILHNDNSIYMIIHVENTFNAFSCKVFGKYLRY